VFGKKQWNLSLGEGVAAHRESWDLQRSLFANENSNQRCVIWDLTLGAGSSVCHLPQRLNVGAST
jgi:hypothetical protein